VAFVATGPRHGPTTLFRSTDGGAHFERAVAPRPRASGGPMTLQSLVFTDPAHGYALLGPDWPSTVLETTSDGGRSWSRDDLPRGPWRGILGVDGHGAIAYAVALRRGTCQCRVGLFLRRTDAFRWHYVSALPRRDDEGGIGMAAWGGSLWLTLGVGNTRRPVTLFSADAGSTFRRLPPLQAVSCGLTATSPTIVWVDCSTGMLMAFLRYDGTHVQHLGPWGAGTANTDLAALSGSVAVFHSGGGRWAGVWVTSDGGRHFVRTGSLAGLRPENVAGDPSFLTPQIGLDDVYGHGLFRTVDGGSTWHRVPLE